MGTLSGLLWVAGIAGGTLFLLYGAFLALDLHFHASERFERILAQLSLYESLQPGELIASVKAAALAAIAEPLRPKTLVLPPR